MTDEKSRLTDDIKPTAKSSTATTPNTSTSTIPKQNTRAFTRIKSDVDFGPTNHRWLAGAIVTFFLLAVGFNRSCFGVVNDVFVNYYQVTQEAIDWLTLSLNLVSLLGSILLLTVLPFRSVNFRLCCLIMSITSSIAYGMLFVGSLARNFYICLLIGQIILGFVNLFGIGCVPVVAAVWFPDYEMATAVGIMIGGIDVGSILGFVLPSHILDVKDSGTEEFWVIHVEENLRYIFIFFFVVALIFLFVISVYIEEKPRRPPSRAEAIKDSAIENVGLGKMTDSKQTTLFRYLKLPFTDLTFFMLVLCFAVAQTCYMTFTVLLSDIIRSSSDSELTSREVDLQSGNYMTFYSMGGLLGGIVGGFILDKSKQFKAISLTSAVLMTVSAAVFAISLQVNSYLGGVISTCLNGFFNSSCYTALYEIATQHMYPLDELALGSWIVFFVSLTTIILPVVGRAIFISSSSLGVLFLQTGVQAAVVIILIFLKPRHERFSIDTCDEKNVSKGVPQVVQKDP